MKRNSFIKYSNIAQRLERSLNFSRASDFWLMAFRYAKNSENQAWCNARFLMCEYMDMLSKKGALPSCYHNVVRDVAHHSLDKFYGHAYPPLFSAFEDAV